MICPVQDLSTSAFSSTACEPNNVFVWRDLALPQSVTHMLEPVVRSLSVCGSSSWELTRGVLPFHSLLFHLSSSPLSRSSPSLAHTAPPPGHVDPVGAVPAARRRPRHVRLVGRPVRRLFRLGLQEGVQHQVRHSPILLYSESREQSEQVEADAPSPSLLAPSSSSLSRRDFGDSIPGHGGMTDRMDCQFLTGMFVFV